VQQGDKYLIVDLKTTNGITGFDRNFFSLRYHWQAAWYSFGLSKVLGIPLEDVEFYFAVVDTEDPYLTQVVIPSTPLLQEAQDAIEVELAKFHACQETNVWPGLPKRRIIYGRE
jgi:hypothetical protein